MLPAVDRLLRFDMNEFISPGSVTRLVGTFHSPEGLLTSAVRQQPYAVVLFDEIEKADIDALVAGDDIATNTATAAGQDANENLITSPAVTADVEIAPAGALTLVKTGELDPTVIDARSNRPGKSGFSKVPTWKRSRTSGSTRPVAFAYCSART